MLAQIDDGEQGHSFQYQFFRLARSVVHLGSGCGREISGVDPHSDAHLGNINIQYSYFLKISPQLDTEAIQSKHVPFDSYDFIC